MRTVPLILVLFWFYFLVPLVIGRPVGSLASALIAFVLFEAPSTARSSARRSAAFAPARPRPRSRPA
jgi:ABC-type amino acid transport system permease subunit